MSKHLIDQVKFMDVKSEEFFELYCAISEKYWSFEDPDDEQASRKSLYTIAERGDFEHVVLLTKLFLQLIHMEKDGADACAAHLEVGDKKYYFKIASKPEALDNLMRQVRNTVIVQAKEEGKI